MARPKRRTAKGRKQKPKKALSQAAQGVESAHDTMRQILGKMGKGKF